MKKNKKRSNQIKKIFYKITTGGFMFLFSFLLFTSSAYAWHTVDVGDPAGLAVDMMNSIFSNLGVNKSELKYDVQTFNASRRKKIPPQVSLTFTPLNPSPGQKITATATPTYFLNDTKDLYFTWFLKSKNCERTDSPSSEEKKECDLNNDGKVNIYDYKIKAMQIIVNNGFEWKNTDYSSDNDSDGYKAIFGGNDQSGKNPYCYVHDTKSGDEYKIDCDDHLFPHAPSETTGDGSFGKNEEKFWHTDPNSADTAGTGNPDEANVAGLGINQFIWNYEPGDEVGVVVEGVSIEPTQTSDASYRTMWAMPKSMCDVSPTIHNYPKKSTRTISVVNDSPEIGQTTTVTETTTQSIQDRAANIATIESVVTTTTTITDSNTGSIISQNSTSATPTYVTSDISSSISVDNISSTSDLNQCLYDNLINPAESGAQGNKLDVSLSYSPQSPLNGPDGDELVVNSSVLNAQNNDALTYYWQVYKSDEANPDDWGIAFTKTELPDSSQTTGLGLDTFRFKLNLLNPEKYLRVKLTVTEKTDSGLFKQGHSDVVIPITSTSKQIHVYPASPYPVTPLSDSPHLKIDSSEICQNGTNRVLCPVFKDEIIGLQVAKDNLTDFLWTINGKPFTYQTCFFDGCSLNKQTNVAYFPILKDKGAQYTVNLSATDQTTGEKVNLSRTFKVTDPQINLSPVDKAICTPILLGQYVDLNGKSWPDTSTINFQASSGKSIKLTADTSPGFSVSPGNYVWNINGTTDTDNNSTIILPPKDTGESYNVSVGALYSQSDLVKQALNKYWNVSYGQFYEKPVSNNINITIIDSVSASARNPSQKIMASLYSAVPSYLAFLLKIVLTTFIILIGSASILSLFPKIKNE